MVKFLGLLCRLILCLAVLFPVASTAQPVEPGGAQSSMVERSTRDAPVIPFKTHSEISGSFITKLIVVLLVLLGIASAVLYWVKKRFLGDSNNPVRGQNLQILETKRISTKTTVYVIRYEDRRVLLAQTGDSTVVLDKIVEGDHDQHPVAQTTQADKHV